MNHLAEYALRSMLFFAFERPCTCDPNGSEHSCHRCDVLIKAKAEWPEHYDHARDMYARFAR